MVEVTPSLIGAVLHYALTREIEPLLVKLCYLPTELLFNLCYMYLARFTCTFLQQALTH